MKAKWNGKTIAESNATLLVEGNHYFPPESVNRGYLNGSNTHTQCPWKGIASYYHLEVDNHVNKDAAWYYPDPADAAAEIKNYVAFWRGVEVTNE